MDNLKHGYNARSFGLQNSATSGLLHADRHGSSWY